jgi:hypothetical protein
MPARAFLFLLLCLSGFSVNAQNIYGEVLDMEDKQPVADVTIENVHTSLRAATNKQGAFIIPASGGQLLEFKKDGYQLTRVRIPQGYVPSYFRIIIKKGTTEIIDDFASKTTRYDYRRDSIRFHELYKHELEFPKMSTIDMIASPFSAMSGKNREIWQFQDDYDYFEKEKYVDRTFNEALVSKLTGLRGDSLHYYIARYRPSYAQLRAMNDYAFFNFIKETTKAYRNVNTPRTSQ